MRLCGAVWDAVGMSERTISGTVRDTVYVEQGEHVTVLRGAKIQATVSVEGILVIADGGVVQGTAHVHGGGAVHVDGALHGTMSIDRGGELTVNAGGKAVGTLNNGGGVTVLGLIGGAMSGEPPVFLEGGRKMRSEVRDGITFIRE